MIPLVFSHANSFPAGTYRVLFEHLRERGFGVDAVERFGHDPRYPVTSNWPGLVQQLADFARGQAERAGGPVFLVGHSLGGFLSVMAAARHPDIARGVVMIDSPLIGGWRAGALGMAKHAQLVGAVSPGKISRARRNRWDNTEEALEHFRRKKAFSRWDDAVLRDYVDHGLRPHADGGVALHFDRDVETAIYNTLPHNLGRLLSAHPLRCPAAFIGGLASEELRQVGLDLTRRITQGRIAMLDGSHLFPMERPRATAAAIEAAVLNLGGAAR
ncbi:alpha/beta hydrolase [Paracidovorax anthurii]|uniref:Pimeloyl-ACP methyl ester carboxylesterase n=1 Tax=Paracidovorax anthurii TaxID=78229 RepID=A0A328YIX9_9BURK|nr:alpha/beta hydrolase [Paracidovorax anthurii]RAR72705.1 pimeloyl-ACP methyl ester carboxylesterase [Paracidovorax anthurii]